MHVYGGVRTIVVCFCITNINQMRAITNNKNLANVTSSLTLAHTVAQKRVSQQMQYPSMRSLIKHPHFYGLKRKEVKQEIRRSNSMEHPLMGVIVIGSIFFFITMCVSAMVLVFYRKRNTVFVFHKTNQQLENDLNATDMAEESNHYNDDLEEWAAHLSFSSDASLNDLDAQKSIYQPFYYGVLFADQQCSLIPSKQPSANKSGAPLKSSWSQMGRHGGYSKMRTSEAVENDDCAVNDAEIITALTLPKKTQSTVTIAQSGQAKPLEHIKLSNAQPSIATSRNIRNEDDDEDDEEEKEEALGEVLTALLLPTETESLSSSCNSMICINADNCKSSTILPRSQSDNFGTTIKTTRLVSVTRRMPLKHL